MPTKPPTHRQATYESKVARLYHEQNRESTPKRLGIIKRILKAPMPPPIPPKTLLKLVRNGVWHTAGNYPRSHPRETR